MGDFPIGQTFPLRRHSCFAASALSWDFPAVDVEENGVLPLPQKPLIAWNFSMEVSAAFKCSLSSTFDKSPVNPGHV